MNKQIILTVISVVILLFVIGAVSSNNRNFNAKNLQTDLNTNSVATSSIASIGGGDKSATSTLDSFAQCLTLKGLVMYGAEWCSHCKKEKNGFGSSFKYVSYVECPDNTQLCLTKGINGYPTWIDASSALHEGEQGLEGLAKISGCELPVSER